MERRDVLSSAAAGLTVLAAGCSTTDEPGVEPRRRLGTAPEVTVESPVELDTAASAERSFPERATYRATEHAAGRLRELLAADSLTGEGVSVGWGEVALGRLTDTATPVPSESEFDRATETGPIVYHTRQYAGDGTLISEPAVAFGTVVDATPRSVTVTVTGQNQEYVAVLPVLCWHGAIQNG